MHDKYFPLDEFDNFQFPELNERCLDSDKSFKITGSNRDSFIFAASTRAGLTLGLDSCAEKTGRKMDFYIRENAEIELTLFDESSGISANWLNVELECRAKLYLRIAQIRNGLASSYLNIRINHKSPNSFSRIDVRNVLRDSSVCVNYGLLNIDETAKGTDAYLSDKSLLVGERAKATSIPSLEIRTNDVKASHGSSTGRISEEELFYLQSRGLGNKQAEQMLVGSFLRPVLEKISKDLQTKYSVLLQEY